MKLSKKQRNQLNRDLALLAYGIMPDIPIEPIKSILRAYGIIPVSEDGTPWEGILCGQSGKISIDLQYGMEPVDNAKLVISWYRYETGRYEVIVYLS